MIIYNLTDKKPPWERSERTPNKVKIRGVTILPGHSKELSDFPLRQVTGLINAHTISVDSVPRWYQEAKAKSRAESLKVMMRQAKEKSEEKSEE